MNDLIKSVDEKRKSEPTLTYHKVKTPKWSYKYDKCRVCGTTKIKHRARGLCISCYQRDNEQKQRNHLRQRGVAGKKLTREYLLEEYVVNKKSLNDIAKVCSCTRQYVHKKIKAYNIPLRNKSTARGIALDKEKLSFELVDHNNLNYSITLKKVTFDENFFSSWTPEMAWVLGVIYSDGNLYHYVDTNQYRLQIYQKEPELLDKVKSLMRCDARLYFNPRREYENGVAGEIYTLQIQSQCTNQFFLDLLRLGVMPKKSLTIEFPEIPQEFVRHFIRGCWDGDGSVYIGTNSRAIRSSFISGSYHFMSGMLYELEKAGLSKRTIYKNTYKRKNPNYSFRFSGSQCKKLYHYLYDNVPPEQYLERKYNILNTYFS